MSVLVPMIGGGLIGLGASILLVGNGRIAGISGIFAGILAPQAGDLDWRVAFVIGLAIAGLGAVLFAPSTLVGPASRSLIDVAIAGLLVGFGVRLGNGCTSGHGVCGLSRFSPRSLVSTLTFISTGALTVTLMRMLGGAG